MKRTKIQEIIDFITFPIRAISLFEKDKWGLSSLATERFDYASREVKGYCLDVGCGRKNRFIVEFLNNNGKGIDIFPYEGLTQENIVEDITNFPFKNESFNTITFIGNINHIPKSMRDIELAEAYRCVKKSGNVIITMGHPLTEILVHKLVYLYDKILQTNFDMDTERGMHKEESYFLTDEEIKGRLIKAGFKKIKKKYFITQWGFNHLFIGWKE